MCAEMTAENGNGNKHKYVTLTLHNVELTQPKDILRNDPLR